MVTKRIVFVAALSCSTVAFVIAAEAAHAAGVQSECPDQPSVHVTAPSDAARTRVAGPTGEQIIDLGHDNNYNDTFVRLKPTSGTLPPAPYDFEPGPFQSGKAHIPARDVSVTVSRQTADFVELRLCIDPRRGGKYIPAGAYTGSIQVADPRLSGDDIPIKATVQLRQIVPLGWIGIPLTAIIAMLGAWATERRAKSADVFSGDIGKWLGTNGWWSATIGGIASFGVYRQALSNASFGDNGIDVILLVGGMIAAAYAVCAASSAVKGPNA